MYVRDKTIDFVISNSSISEQITECNTELCLHITSNHETILTYLELGNSYPKKINFQKF